jgi:hypothetical protein
LLYIQRHFLIRCDVAPGSQALDYTFDNCRYRPTYTGCSWHYSNDSNHYHHGSTDRCMVHDRFHYSRCRTVCMLLGTAYRLDRLRSFDHSIGSEYMQHPKRYL